MVCTDPQRPVQQLQNISLSRFVSMKKAALTIQKYWRGYKPRQRYIVIRLGYLRLQAAVRSRLLRFSFVKLRTRVVGLQVSCETGGRESLGL